MVIHREFCDTCGSFILEYGVGLIQYEVLWRLTSAQDAVKHSFRYIAVGSLDDPEVLPPKGEFFCKSRVNWMPEIPSQCHTSLRIISTSKLTHTDVFHKQEIKQ